jgi:hypothetical protein
MTTSFAKHSQASKYEKPQTVMLDARGVVVWCLGWMESQCLCGVVSILGR